MEEIGGLRWAFQYGVNKDLYYRLDRDRVETELGKPAKPQRGEESDFIESVMRERARERAKRGIGEGEQRPLVYIYKKPSLSAYLYNQVLDPINYASYLILTFAAYLAFMFLRSVVWSVRTLRRREGQ